MQVAIIGCGNMGRSLARRLSQHATVFLYDVIFKKAQQLETEGYGSACHTLSSAIISADFIILAVKPQNFTQDFIDHINKSASEQMLISVLAGTSLHQLQAAFQDREIVRMMPNLAVAYGEGLIGLVSDGHLSEETIKEIEELCTPLGKIYWIHEDKINAFTSLAGSGPAFMLTVIEATIESGIAMGLDAQEARSVTYQMMRGTLSLVENTQQHPAELKWQMASSGGTTIAGLKALEEFAVRAGILNTFLAAYERADELTS